ARAQDRLGLRHRGNSSPVFSTGYRTITKVAIWLPESRNSRLFNGSHKATKVALQHPFWGDVSPLHPTPKAAQLLNLPQHAFWEGRTPDPGLGRTQTLGIGAQIRHPSGMESGSYSGRDQGKDRVGQDI